MDYYHIFQDIPENIVYCINKTNLKKISVELEIKGCSILDCSNKWRKYQKKIIAESNTCLQNCSNDSIYKYEYENKCYDICPNGTHNNNYICEINFIEVGNSETEINETEFSETEKGEIETHMNFEDNKSNKNDENTKDNICLIKEFFLEICKINIKTSEKKNIY